MHATARSIIIIRSLANIMPYWIFPIRGKPFSNSGESVSAVPSDDVDKEMMMAVLSWKSWKSSGLDGCLIFLIFEIFFKQFKKIYFLS